MSREKLFFRNFNWKDRTIERRKLPALSALVYDKMINNFYTNENEK